MVKFREALIHAVNYAFEEYGIRIDDFVAIEMVNDQQIFEYKLSKEVQKRIKSGSTLHFSAEDLFVFRRKTSCFNDYYRTQQPCRASTARGQKPWNTKSSSIRLVSNRKGNHRSLKFYQVFLTSIMINVLWKSQWKDLHGASTYLSHHWLVERNISAYDDEELQMWSHLNVVTQFNDNSYATKSESRDYENFTKSVLEEYELNDIEYPYNVSF